jgi:ribonuclease-3
MGRGMMGHHEVPSNILADVFESMVAAIYLDGGLEAAKTFILEYLMPEIEHAAGGGHGNHKSILQQLAQRQFGDTPKYRVLDEQGPDHNKCFKIAAEINKQRYPAAWGINKKEAEQKAAMNALAAIRGEPVPHAADY